MEDNTTEFKHGDTRIYATKNGKKYIQIYSVCPDCGIGIWKRRLEGKPEYERCKSCGQKHRNNEARKKLYKGTVENPVEGDIRPGWDLGRETYRKFGYLKCEKCDTIRWVQVFNGKARTPLCIKCRNRYVGEQNIKVRGSFSKGTIENPTVGDIRYGDEIGKEYCKSIRYIWAECTKCHVEKWTRAKSISGMCRECYDIDHPTKENNGRYKGGFYDEHGYKYVRIGKDSPYWEMGTKSKTGNYKSVAEHRLVMAKHIGRCLKPWEEVHHMHTKYPQGSFEDKHDNRIENLELKSTSDHHGLTVMETKILRLENKVETLEEQIKNTNQLVKFLMWERKRLEICDYND